jgi:hypothetical protein
LLMPIAVGIAPVIGRAEAEGANTVEPMNIESAIAAANRAPRCWHWAGVT